MTCTQDTREKIEAARKQFNKEEEEAGEEEEENFDEDDEEEEEKDVEEEEKEVKKSQTRKSQANLIRIKFTHSSSVSYSPVLSLSRPFQVSHEVVSI